MTDADRSLKAMLDSLYKRTHPELSAVARQTAVDTFDIGPLSKSCVQRSVGCVAEDSKWS